MINKLQKCMQIVGGNTHVQSGGRYMECDANRLVISGADANAASSVGDGGSFQALSRSRAAYCVCVFCVVLYGCPPANQFAYARQGEQRVTHSCPLTQRAASVFALLGVSRKKGC